MASYALASNITYKPNTRLIKLQSAPIVYSVSRCGVLHPLGSESVAAVLFGSTWTKNVDDLSDAFFPSYTVGATIQTVADYTATSISTISENICTLAERDALLALPSSNTNTPAVNNNINTNTNSNTNGNTNSNTNTSTNTNTVTPPVTNATATVTINQQVTTNPNASKLFGANFDGRTSIDMPNSKNKGGYYDYKTGLILPAVAPMWDPIHFHTLRYPASPANVFDWKGTVKPKYAVNFTGQVRTLAFGFDEFMDMAKNKGIAPADIQITINIHSIPTATDPLQNAADWVEYANAPNNGSNPGGGTDWAAVRGANGHPNPWGIELWNIGLEPWSDLEYKIDPVPYLAVAVPIIDAMRQIDPTIKILIPAGGTASVSASRRAAMTTWDTTIINSPLLKGKIYGLTPHYYYDNNVSGGTIPRGVAAIEGALDLLIQQIGSTGLKIVIGEQSHTITTNNNIPVGDPNIATQWSGVIVNADFLMMASQKTAVERTEFFTYGVPISAWHPIRENPDGSYTLMPVGTFHQMIGDLFYDRALSVSASFPKASDGNAYAIRAGAFQSPSGATSIFVVNRDPGTDHTVQIQGMVGKTVTRARLLTASSLTAETFQTTTLSVTNTNNPISVPRSSVLILELN
jgi:alpha-L-arabinofuranosidase